MSDKFDPTDTAGFSELDLYKLDQIYDSVEEDVDLSDPILSKQVTAKILELFGQGADEPTIVEAIHREYLFNKE